MILTGCTCKHTFTIPCDKDDICAMYITYRQNGKTVLEKTLTDCELTAGKVCVPLTQEDTLAFQDETCVKIQLKLKRNDGTVMKSKIIDTYSDVVFNKEVI